ncbi:MULTISPECIES: hypothetical protein [Trichocoleus]|uniref:Uncharacterized protein n=1 Tax=Trichocoleus desertorum GB2-A4 TaxID=2933944 RepID=A0ABV0J1N2_9CYAN|nr:hypothetical protein [Trichocoleus sp. FACHB-46]MBD1860299.1 hypothetical protein [Trichocoleus sp. FACHB-46]
MSAPNAKPFEGDRSQQCLINSFGLGKAFSFELMVFASSSTAECFTPTDTSITGYC